MRTSSLARRLTSQLEATLQVTQTLPVTPQVIPKLEYKLSFNKLLSLRPSALQALALAPCPQAPRKQADFSLICRDGGQNAKPRALPRARSLSIDEETSGDQVT